jgi:predicted amidophosphoribosyltransferase
MESSLTDRRCVSCGTSLPATAIFCSECGTYQGQPGIDNRPDVPASSASQTRAAGPTDQVHCPNCGAFNSALTRACVYCFRPMVPVAPLSGPELRKPSRGLVWFLMGGAAVCVLGYAILEVVVFVLTNHT